MTRRPSVVASFGSGAFGAPAPPATVRRITPEDLDAADFLSSSTGDSVVREASTKPDEYPLQITVEASASASGVWKIPARDLVDETGLLVAYLSIDIDQLNVGGSPLWYLGMGLWDGVATTWPVAAFGPRTNDSTWYRATLDSPTPNTFSGVTGSTFVQDAPQFIQGRYVCDLAPDGSYPRSAAVVGQGSVIPGSPKTLHRAPDTSATSVRDLLPETDSLATPFVAGRFSEDTAAAISGDPFLMFYVSIQGGPPSSNRTARVDVKVQLPAARGLLTWAEANP